MFNSLAGAPGQAPRSPARHAESPLGSEDARPESELDEDEERDTLSALHSADIEALAAADAAAMRNPADGFGSMIGGIVNAVASIFSHRSSASLPWSQRESPRDASPGPERDASYEA